MSHIFKLPGRQREREVLEHLFIEEFMVDQVRRLAGQGGYRYIVWDTAPLGQALALLGTPSLLTDHLRMAPRIHSHLRTSGEHRESVMAALKRWDELPTITPPARKRPGARRSTA